VFVDEIDQMVSRGGSGDSGVGSRFFKRLLEFMSDGSHRGKVIFLAATNRPDLMDAALRRPGRFDKKVPFLVPDASEREAIFQVMARKYGLEVKKISKSVVAATDGYTGAEIEAVVVKAVEVAEDDVLAPDKALDYAVGAISPSTSDIQFMTGIAIRECNDRDLLPPAYRGKLDDRAKLDAEIKATAPRGAREL
jgi:SpoVK/Ycf46/Vps4 family AAA+-type ATPase